MLKKDKNRPNKTLSEQLKVQNVTLYKLLYEIEKRNAKKNKNQIINKNHEKTRSNY